MRKLITLISAMSIFLFDVKQALSCADGSFCAVVRSTRDGFVALRDRPKASSKLIYNLKPYQIVVIFSSDCAPNRDTDPWTQVDCVPEGDGDCDPRYGRVAITVATIGIRPPQSRADDGVACTRFRGHRVRCFDG